MNKTRLALIGAGRIGKIHLKAMSEVSEVELVAIVDTNTELKQLSKHFSVPFFQSSDEMIRAVTPDGVIVGTPTEIHFGPVASALKSGVHVLVEKPIAQSVEEAQKIISLSEQTSREVLVGHHRRYYGILQKTRQLIHDGALGQLVAVQGIWTTRKADAYYEPEGRKKRSSGPVLINLIHEIDMLRYICGEVRSISAKVSGWVRNHPKEESAAMVMELENGVLGTFLISDVTPSPWTWEHATGENEVFPKSAQNTFRFVGTEACLEFPNLSIWKTDGNTDWHHPMIREDYNIPLENAYILQCKHFCKVINKEEKPRITAQDATRTLAATLAVFEASESGKQVLL